MERAAGERRQDAGSNRVAEDVVADHVGHVYIAAGGIAGYGRGMDSGGEGHAAIERSEASAGTGGEGEHITDVGRRGGVISSDVDVGAGSHRIDRGGRDYIAACSAGALRKIGGGNVAVLAKRPVGERAIGDRGTQRVAGRRTGTNNDGEHAK
jgi:hypothetical protein